LFDGSRAPTAIAGDHGQACRIVAPSARKNGIERWTACPNTPLMFLRFKCRNNERLLLSNGRAESCGLTGGENNHETKTLCLISSSLAVAPIGAAPRGFARHSRRRSEPLLAR
jgi:hypothetical protein